MTDALEIAQAVLTAIGAASALAAALKPLVLLLQKWALKTAWKGDDAIFQTASVALEGFAVGLAWLYKGLALVGLTPKRRDDVHP